MAARSSAENLTNSRTSHLVRKDHRTSRGSPAPLSPDRQLRLAGRQRRLAGGGRRPRGSGEDVSEKSGLQEIFEEISPIEDFSETMSSRSRTRSSTTRSTPSRSARRRTSPTPRPLYVSAEFTNNETGEIKGQTVFMGDFPLMTPKGTFIINGTERVVV